MVVAKEPHITDVSINRKRFQSVDQFQYLEATVKASGRQGFVIKEFIYINERINTATKCSVPTTINFIEREENIWLLLYLLIAW